MAAPILGIIGQAAPAAATNGDAYTVPAARRAVVSSIVICNTGASQTAFRIFARKGGAVAAVGNAVAYDIAIGGNSTTCLITGITLAAADILTVESTAGGVTFTVFGEETDIPTS